MAMMQTRRRFLTTASLAAAANLVRSRRLLAGEEALETTSVTLAKTPALCNAPQFIAEELLRAEGFTEVRFVEVIEPEVPSAVGAFGMPVFAGVVRIVAPFRHNVSDRGLPPRWTIT